MENTNSNYEKLFDETVAHSKVKKYLTKIFIKSKNKYSDPTYHKKTLLSLLP